MHTSYLDTGNADQPPVFNEGEALNDLLDTGWPLLCTIRGEVPLAGLAGRLLEEFEAVLQLVLSERDSYRNFFPELQVVEDPGA